jgi:hypothetical protein
MTAKELGEQPVTAMWHMEHYVQHSGLTKREWFAGNILAAMISNHAWKASSNGGIYDAIEVADALLAELAKEVK